jgi:hypothetical protein
MKPSSGETRPATNDELQVAASSSNHKLGQMKCSSGETRTATNDERQVAKKRFNGYFLLKSTFTVNCEEKLVF